jgi:hypothetical protein
MQVDDPWHYEFASEVDGLCTAGRLQSGSCADPSDPAIVHDHRGIRHRLPAGSIDQSEMRQDFRFGRCR